MIRGLRFLTTSVPSTDKIGASYIIGDSLYISLTDKANSNTLIETRGPNFTLPQSFHPLGDSEPTAAELAAIIDDHYKNLDIIGMGENDAGVSFAGMGEPTLRLETLIETVKLVKERRHGVPFRVVTNGLCSTEAAIELKGAGVESATVALMASNPTQYAQLMSPSGPFSFSDVCAFIVALSEAGISTECTAVKRPGVNMKEVQQLAEALGAVSFRAREYFE
jgi:TatD family-associated radical SAM protein